MHFRNRVTRDLGVDIPIVQAPMGWIARSQLASAVSSAGAFGIIETSSGELDAIRGETRCMTLGVYHDEYVFEHDSWRFARRRLDILYKGLPDLSGTTLPFPSEALIQSNREADE